MVEIVKGLGFGTNNVVHAKAPASTWYGSPSKPKSVPGLRQQEAASNMPTAFTNHETTPYLAHKKETVPCFHVATDG